MIKIKLLNIMLKKKNLSKVSWRIISWKIFFDFYLSDMRCRFRRLIYFLLLTISLTILYQIFLPTRKSQRVQSPFQVSTK